jgi:sterol desaturase/sphingolipid hydroxylase (fatty acid hydroxylase superfamily)
MAALPSLPFGLLVLVCAVAISLLVAAALAAGFLLERQIGDRRRIFALERRDGQLRWETIGTVRFVALASIAFAALLKIVPTAPSTVASFGTTVGVCWVAFEIYYWGLHRWMHSDAGYRFHKFHHESRVTSPMTGYSMSTTESLGWLVGLIGIPLLLGFMMPISIEGLVTYHVLYQVPGNVIGHANVDFFPPAAAKRINSWISHPTLYHSLHHARFVNHYSFGSSFMDRLLGTEWKDWPALHAKVTSGQPLESFSERG